MQNRLNVDSFVHEVCPRFRPGPDSSCKFLLPPSERALRACKIQAVDFFDPNEPELCPTTTFRSRRCAPGVMKPPRPEPAAKGTGRPRLVFRPSLGRIFLLPSRTDASASCDQKNGQGGERTQNKKKRGQGGGARSAIGTRNFADSSLQFRAGDKLNVIGFRMLNYPYTFSSWPIPMIFIQFFFFKIFFGIFFWKKYEKKMMPQV